MRLHKFETPNAGPVWIDLDAVVSVRRGGLADTESEITAGNWTHLVAMPLDDVLALISPPAAPDTFEEKLAQSKGHDPIKIFYPDKYGIIRELEAESTGISERLARLDEIERFRVLIRSGCSWDYLDHHINRRRTEIEQGA